MKREKAVTKDMVVGMQVIDAEGNFVGTVKDVAFTVGKVGMSLYVECKKGETRDVSWDEVQAVGDYIILKPVTQAAAQQAPTACPTCNGPLSFVQQYQRWYCYRCKKYV